MAVRCNCCHSMRNCGGAPAQGAFERPKTINVYLNKDREPYSYLN